MAQLTVYIDEGTLKKISLAAKEEGESVSKWVKRRLEESFKENLKGWPKGYLEWLDSLKDNPVDIDVPEDLGWDLDRPREKL